MIELGRRDFVKSAALAAGALAAARTSFAGEVDLPRQPLDGRPTLAPGAQPGGVDAATKELLLEALDAARAGGAEYADARIALLRNRFISTREEQITGVNESTSLGLGVRALTEGSWGFAATRELTQADAARVGRLAATIGGRNARIAPSPVTLAPVDSYGEVSWRSAYEIDPWDVPLGDMVEHLLALNRTAMKAESVRFVSSSLHFVKIEQTTATAEGTIAAQTIVRVNPNLSITAITSDRSDFQTRTSVLEPAGRGWEYIRDNFTSEATEVWAAEAGQKLSAAGVEPGQYDLILHPSNLWLTIHESIGHPTELDRALGYEANYAGTSFLAPPEAVLAKLQIGSPLVNFEAERTSPSGLATIGWDEEGVKTEAWPLVTDGVFVDYQTTREQAAWISDLTGIERGTYGFKLIVQLGPTGARPEELLRIDDVPLQCEATR